MIIKKINKQNAHSCLQHKTWSILALAYNDMEIIDRNRTNEEGC